MLLYLQRFEMVDPSLFAGDLPSEIDIRFRLAAIKHECNAWRSYYDSIVAKTKELKTDRGRRNAVQRYFETVSTFESRISSDAKAMIQDHSAELKVIEINL